MKHTPDFVRTLRDISETVLLGSLHGMTHEDLPAAFESLMKVLEEDGVPGPVIEEDLSFETPTRYFGNDGITDVDSTSFSMIMSLALCLPTEGELHSAQSSWPRRLWMAMEDLPEARQALFDELLSKTCGITGNVPMVGHLIDVGADPCASVPSKAVDLRGQHSSAFTEALCRRQIDKAVFLLPLLGKGFADNVVHQIIQGHPAQHDARKSCHVESIWMARELIKAASKNKNNASPLDLLDVIEEKLGPKVADKVRMRLLNDYLARCHSEGDDWDFEVVKRMTHHRTQATPSPPPFAVNPPSLPSSLWDFSFHPFLERLAQEKAPSEMQRNHGMAQDEVQWHEILNGSFKSHCYPVIEAMSPHMRIVFNANNDAPHKKDSAPSMALLLKGYPSHVELKGTWPEGFHVENFRRSLVLVLEAGANLESPVNALHTLAVGAEKNEGKGMLRKLVILLEMGANPSALNDDGRTPDAMIENSEVKKQWQAIVHSFKARQTVTILLEDLASEEMGAYVGP